MLDPTPKRPALALGALPEPALDSDHHAAEIAPRIAIGSIMAMWAVYFLINTGLAALLQQPDFWDALGRRLIVIGTGIVLTLALYAWLRRSRPRRFGRRMLLAFGGAVPLTLVYVVFNLLVFIYWVPAPETTKQLAEMQAKFPSSWLAIVLIDSALRWYFFFAVWAALYVAFGYALETQAMERRANQYRQAAQAAQLRALHYQVNPHFLFNTLNSLSSLVLRDRRDDAESMIMNLSAFLRTSLTIDPEQDVTLAEEIALQELYLSIEQARFPERLTIAVDVPERLTSACVPVLILQPLIENAIKYGVSATSRPVSIALTAREDGEKLDLTIRNSIDPEAIKPAAGTGVGLANVRQRLLTRFGDQASADWGHDGPDAFVVSLRMPLSRHHC